MKQPEKIKAIYCVKNPPTKRLKSRRYYKCRCEPDACSMAAYAAIEDGIKRYSNALKELGK